MAAAPRAGVLKFRHAIPQVLTERSAPLAPGLCSALNERGADADGALWHVTSVVLLVLLIVRTCLEDHLFG